MLKVLARPYRLAFLVYPCYTIAALNILDFALTAILIVNGWDVEANPIILAAGGVFSPFNIINKLVVVPALAILVVQRIYSRYGNRARIGAFFRFVVWLVLIFYFGIVSLGLGDVLAHMGVI